MTCPSCGADVGNGYTYMHNVCIQCGLLWGEKGNGVDSYLRERHGPGYNEIMVQVPQGTMPIFQESLEPNEMP